MVLDFLKRPYQLVLLLICFTAGSPLSAAVEQIQKVVIWGHKLHSHTHSYIHHAFYIAFRHLGYSTYWFDNSDTVSDFDFSNALFLTEGQVDAKIPIRDDCFYILHNCSVKKYESQIKAGKAIILQVYTDDILKYQTQEIAKCIHFNVDGQTIHMPWATDLLPHEIDEMKAILPENHSSNKIYWIGTIGAGKYGNIEELNPFITACKENGYEFIHLNRVGQEKSRQLIKESYIAPAIVGTWQNKAGYIPCRIFKNISYGHMGVTNSYRVYELFNQKIIYNPDTYQLFYDAHRTAFDRQSILKLMDEVRDHHTYINRIQTLFQFLDLVEKHAAK
jgi:hypothetical protein